MDSDPEQSTFRKRTQSKSAREMREKAAKAREEAEQLARDEAEEQALLNQIGGDLDELSDLERKLEGDLNDEEVDQLASDTESDDWPLSDDVCLALVVLFILKVG